MVDMRDNSGETPAPQPVKDLPEELRFDKLSDCQKLIFGHAARIRVAVCGRRFGKTTLGESAAANVCRDKPGAMVWWVAAAKDQAARSYRHLMHFLSHASWTKKDGCIKLKRIEFNNGSAIEFLTAGSGDRLRGAGLDFLVVDEAADVPEDVWASVLRPALVDRNGRALILGTPRGRGNWLHRLWHQGNLSEYAGRVKSFQFTSLQSGRIKPKDLDDCKPMMSENQFKQEFEAEFLECSGAVFKDFRPLATEVLMKRGEPVARYATGIDIGRRNDATVAITLRWHPSGPAKMVGYEPLVDKTWQEQERILEDYLKRFPGVVAADATGMGDPLVEHLRGCCPRVEGFTFTEKSKTELISRLQLAFNTQAIRIADAGPLLSELETFEYEQEEDGRKAKHFPRYGAPPGHHDDHVIALALTWHALVRNYGPPIMDEAGVGKPAPRAFKNGFYA